MGAGNADQGQRVRERRIALGLTQQGLADELGGSNAGWHSTTLSRIEAGVRPIRLVEAVALAAVLDRSLDWLAMGAGPHDQGSREADALADKMHRARAVLIELAASLHTSRKEP